MPSFNMQLIHVQMHVFCFYIIIFSAGIAAVVRNPGNSSRPYCCPYRLSHGRCHCACQQASVLLRFSFNYSLLSLSCRQPDFIEFDITPIVQNWALPIGNNNYGVMVQAIDGNIYEKSPRFVADEGPVNKRPYLEVNCLT